MDNEPPRSKLRWSRSGIQFESAQQAGGNVLEKIQSAAETFARLWLVYEISLANPMVVVTLSDKQVYQRSRRAFGLRTPTIFTKAVWNPHMVSMTGIEVTLFPMIHPGISRSLGDGDNRKLNARRKWSGIHQ